MKEGIHQIVVRLPVSLHAPLQKLADRESKGSINAQVVALIEQAVKK